ncbi:hypothetical protein E2562_039480 [Oryza meyeriana var. granulata]|uniref:Uncharacterized protein n=1 Tax=Oryza meyeriana var. granulata TaxID=110450 RepID=A0A6G1EUK1_9ORYZ|nr:hypothetical protein E2562_039480 [Oryza meyeriana var. granulata]
MAAWMNELSLSTRWSIDRLRVEFIDTNTTNSVTRLITTAVDAWGVEHLEVAAAPMTSLSGPMELANKFSGGRISNDPHSSQLKTLKLTKC